MNYIDYIDKIREASSNKPTNKNESLRIGDYYVRLWYDDDGTLLDGLEFTTEDIFGWVWSNPKEFVCNHMYSQIDFIEHQVSVHGNTPLKKPKELRGVKSCFSLDYIHKKCKCLVFIHGNDVWVKHRDYFSSYLEIDKSDIGSSLNKLRGKYLHKKKGSTFIYEDAWGSIVLRNEAWICIKNLKSRLEIDSYYKLCKDIVRKQEQISMFNFKELELEDSYMMRFWEDLIRKLDESF